MASARVEDASADRVEQRLIVAREGHRRGRPCASRRPRRHQTGNPISCTWQRARHSPRKVQDAADPPFNRSLWLRRAAVERRRQLVGRRSGCIGMPRVEHIASHRSSLRGFSRSIPPGHLVFSDYTSERKRGAKEIDRPLFSAQSRDSARPRPAVHAARQTAADASSS
jgi:hypothetical protein